MTTRIDDLSVRLTTEYASNARLAMWIPVRFREEYVRGADANRRSRHEYEWIQCEGVYSNYRRFEASARIR